MGVFAHVQGHSFTFGCGVLLVIHWLEFRTLLAGIGTDERPLAVADPAWAPFASNFSSCKAGEMPETPPSRPCPAQQATRIRPVGVLATVRRSRRCPARVFQCASSLFDLDLLGGRLRPRATPAAAPRRWSQLGGLGLRDGAAGEGVVIAL
jgi:hypothetical protein